MGHLNDEFQIKDPILLQYYHLVRAGIESAFEQLRIEHIPRIDNIRADILSKLASNKLKSRHRSLLQQTLSTPSITNTCHNLNHTSADNITPPQTHNYTTPYIQYLQTVTSTNADMANRFSNVSLQNKHIISLRSCMKAFAATILTYVLWPPESFKPITSGRL